MIGLLLDVASPVMSASSLIGVSGQIARRHSKQHLSGGSAF